MRTVLVVGWGGGGGVLEVDGISLTGIRVGNAAGALSLIVLFSLLSYCCSVLMSNDSSFVLS